MVDSASKSKTIGKIRKRLGDIKPLPLKPLPQSPQLPQSQTKSVYTTKKIGRVLKKMPIKIQDIKNILNNFSILYFELKFQRVINYTNFICNIVTFFIF